MTRRVVVIGGGPAGLTALHHLGRAGFEAHLFDPAPGGLLRTIRQDGFTIEAGAHSIASSDPDVMGMVDALGVADAVIRPRAEARRRFVLFRGALSPVPTSAGELVASPLLSVRGRLRLLKEPFVGPRVGDDTETVDAFARRRFGAEVADRMIDPIVSSSTGGDAHALLARALFPRHVEFERAGGSVLRGAMRAGMQARRTAGRTLAGPWTHRDGIGTIADACIAAAGAGRVHRSAVRAIALTPDGAVITTDAGSLPFDAAVIAVSPAALRSIHVAGIDPSHLDTLIAMPHASVVTVSFGFRRAAVGHALDGTSVLVPSGAKRHLLAAFFESTMHDGRAPEGHVLITCIAGGVRHPGVIARDDGEIGAVVLEELRPLLAITGTPVLMHVERWPDAMPQAVAGHFERLAAVDAIERREPRVAFAGGWRAGMSVGEAMISGKKAASRVLAACPLLPPSTPR